MKGAKILELVMFWIFEKCTVADYVQSGGFGVGLAMPIPGLLDKMPKIEAAWQTLILRLGGSNLKIEKPAS